MEMFARDQMKLHACAWPSWRCLLVKLEIFARDYMQLLLLVIKLEMFACDQMQLHVCIARACMSDRCSWLDISYIVCACICLLVSVVSIHRLGNRVASLSLTTQLVRT